ncbi:MAG: hypothetical protein IJ640_03850 [Prevotella sp.]|nr:hypothetical protein [Prevotella sp.]
MKELNKDLLKAATERNLCDDGKRIIRRADFEEMIQQYHDHIGWHMEHDNPPEEVLRKHFEGYINQWAAVGVKGCNFVDEKTVLLCLDSEGEARFTNGKRGRVFIRHDSELTLYAEPHTFIVVSVYDNATLRVHPADTARVCVYLHGVNAKVIDTPDMPKQVIIKTRQ